MNLVQILLVENSFLREKLRKYESNQMTQHKNAKDVVLLSPSFTAGEAEELRARSFEGVCESNDSQRAASTDQGRDPLVFGALCPAPRASA